MLKAFSWARSTYLGLRDGVLGVECDLAALCNGIIQSQQEIDKAATPRAYEDMLDLGENMFGIWLNLKNLCVIRWLEEVDVCSNMMPL